MHSMVHYKKNGFLWRLENVDKSPKNAFVTYSDACATFVKNIDYNHCRLRLVTFFKHHCTLATFFKNAFNKPFCMLWRHHPTINDDFKTPLYVDIFFQKNTFRIKIHFNMLGKKNKKNDLKTKNTLKFQPNII